MNVRERMEFVIKAEAEAIRGIKVDESFERAVDEMAWCQGKIITTGIGKAGHIARKFAATLSSTGTPSCFVHAAEAAHGDLGTIDPGGVDIIIAFSTSGKSREVIEMLERVRPIGQQCGIGITSHPDSELWRLCDIVLDMGVIPEPCPLGLTPSASVAVMLAISDALALALLEQKGLSTTDWATRHHGGYLGQKANGQ